MEFSMCVKIKEFKGAKSPRHHLGSTPARIRENHKVDNNFFTAPWSHYYCWRIRIMINRNRWKLKHPYGPMLEDCMCRRSYVSWRKHRWNHSKHNTNQNCLNGVGLMCVKRLWLEDSLQIGIAQWGFRVAPPNLTGNQRKSWCKIVQSVLSPLKRI